MVPVLTLSAAAPVASTTAATMMTITSGAMPSNQQQQQQRIILQLQQQQQRELSIGGRTRTAKSRRFGRRRRNDGSVHDSVGWNVHNFVQGLSKVVSENHSDDVVYEVNESSAIGSSRRIGQHQHQRKGNEGSVERVDSTRQFGLGVSPVGLDGQCWNYKDDEYLQFVYNSDRKSTRP